MKRPVLVAIASLFVAGGAIAGLFYETILWFNMPSATRFPIRGIDVSHHQGAIDWKAGVMIQSRHEAGLARVIRLVGCHRQVANTVRSNSSHLPLFA